MQHTYPIFTLRLLILSLCLQLPLCAHAQIKTDGSVGPTAQTLIGPQYTIPQSLGQLAGSNLFHSFQTFNINTGESANFTTSTAGIANVISRVTGGSASNINGTLSLTPASGTPAFFFINPAGVTFGKGASVDVPGALHISTANYLNFPDGEFHTNLQKSSTFSSAAPEAFGFLGSTRAALVIKDGTVIGVTPKQAINLMAGDITVDNGVVRTNGGDIRAASVGQTAQRVALTHALPVAAGDMQIVNGGQIYAPSGNGFDAGNIVVSAGNITIDGKDSANFTWIASSAENAGSGKAGSVEVTAAQDLKVFNGGKILSGTFATGDAGIVKVSANNITIDGQGKDASIYSGAYYGSSGKAGGLEVTAAQDLQLLNGGTIESGTLATGDAGTVKVSANNITIDGQGSDKFTWISSSAYQGSSGKAGSVEVTTAQDLKVRNGGKILSGTFATGDAGIVKVSANNIIIDGQGKDASIYSGAYYGSSGRAGGLEVTAAQDLQLLNGGTIESSTLATGDAGTVKVSANNITIDGQGSTKFTWISSSAYEGSSGKAGSVEVTAAQDLKVLNGGILSGTEATGDAGIVKVSASNIVVDGQGIGAGISSGAYSGSVGKAGSVEVTATQDLRVLNGGLIDSSTNSQGDSGSVTVSANNITIDGQGTGAGISSGTYYSGSDGKASKVKVTAAQDLRVLNDGFIDSSTMSKGNSGSVIVSANNITIDGHGKVAAISSSAFQGSSGTAGSTEITATQYLRVLNGGKILSVTHATGDAGTVSINAGNITIDGQGSDYFTGISSGAFPGSSGQTGNVHVFATQSITLRNLAAIDISNSATVTNPEKISPTQLTVTAPGILLKDDSEISARSTFNIAASNITVNADKLLLDASRITTSANEGNGGAITVNGNGLLLNNSQITTSVTGTSGDGGNIAVHAAALALNTGFIQANTAANNAKGGNVTIDVKALAPSAGNSLFLGGSTPYTFKSDQFGYNVIQAAAPTGLNGEIHTTALAIDISGALAGLGAPALDAGGMGRNPCRIGGGSSFAKSGRGGFAPSARRSLVPLLAVSGATASALPATLDQQLVSAPLDCGKS
ncbi:MAG: filamentous hemagglutinin N-terminal domain-containing protein [Rhodoferax sp.]|nr:filamentous hemagglutinin N-terminal domain-containing protein [Rhodoferax sp.]